MAATQALDDQEGVPMALDRRVLELEEGIRGAADERDDPALAEAMIEYMRAVRDQPYLTENELKSLFISYNGRGLARGESERYPISDRDAAAFERIHELTEISTNSLEGVLRTHARATPELIEAQKERSLSREVADIISRLDRDSAWLQGRVVQVYFETGMETKKLRKCVGALLEHRVPERQQAILDQFSGTAPDPGQLRASAPAALVDSIADALSALNTLDVAHLDDSELLELMRVLNVVRPRLSETQLLCLSEVTRRFGSEA
jgi:hypothetical protein